MHFCNPDENDIHGKSKSMEILKRLKNLVVSLAVAGGLWTAPVLAAGTTPLSMVQQFDQTGQPLANCLLYFFQAGTVATPQNAFSDFGLTATLPNPVQCDISGRIPQHWLADGLIHIRLTDSSGLPIIDTTMQVLGPSSGGGGGGGTVDPTTVMATGDIKARYGTGALSGFVRANGLTIGNGGSGATERANADTQTLFIYLYGADANLAVSGGRTGNALNDFNSGKQLTLPDWRGRALAALDDMGNSAAGRLTSAFFGTSATVLGASGGTESQTLSLVQLPTGITSTGTISVSTGGNVFAIEGNGVFNGVAQVALGATGSFVAATSAGGWAAQNTLTGGNSMTSNNTSGSAHPIVQPTMLATIYLKL
jgi:hypothetical protein